MTVYAFEVRCGEFSRIVNAHNRGKAIAEYMSDVRDCWPDVRFTDFRARKLGQAHTSAAFERTAAYRGWAGVKCGQRVRLKDGGELGTIVGHNDSANFDVVFDEGTSLHGRVCNCHPSDLERVATDPITAGRTSKG